MAYPPVPNGQLCELCHVHPAVCEHHIIPRSQDGDDTPENKIWLDDFCHRIVHKMGTAKKAEWLRAAKIAHRALIGQK